MTDLKEYAEEVTCATSIILDTFEKLVLKANGRYTTEKSTVRHYLESLLAEREALRSRDPEFWAESLPKAVAYCKSLDDTTAAVLTPNGVVRSLTLTDEAKADYCGTDPDPSISGPAAEAAMDDLMGADLEPTMAQGWQRGDDM